MFLKNFGGKLFDISGQKKIGVGHEFGILFVKSKYYCHLNQIINICIINLNDLFIITKKRGERVMKRKKWTQEEKNFLLEEVNILMKEGVPQEEAIQKVAMRINGTTKEAVRMMFYRLKKQQLEQKFINEKNILVDQDMIKKHPLEVFLDHYYSLVQKNREHLEVIKQMEKTIKQLTSLLNNQTNFRYKYTVRNGLVEKIIKEELNNL